LPHTPILPDRQPEAAEPQAAWFRRLVGTPGVILTFLWGFAEGTLFFIVPDVVLSLVAMVAPRRAWRHILGGVGGAVLAGILLFAWAMRDPGGAQDAVAHVPFVTARMFAYVDASYRRHGIGAVFLGPLSGIPYKIYGVEAPKFLGKTVFLACTAPARAERFVLVWAGFGVLGSWLRQARHWSAAKIAAVHGAFWVVFYAFYWSVIG
jgi:hypothetical protein